MGSLLNGIPGVIVYLDDILAADQTEEAHLSALHGGCSEVDRRSHAYAA